jgi:glyoxylase-like metal-dependent hydrolase (beta-lactamase superfamily II)
MIDGGAMFGVVPKSMWLKQYHANEMNLCNNSLRSMLIEYKNKKILIDAGIGDKQDEKFLRHYYLNGKETLENSLKEIHIEYKDITDVVLSHLHFDHCGGAVSLDREKNIYYTTFPNATYWVSKAQWDLALNPNRREKASCLRENFIPIRESGQLKLLETDTELTDRISLKLFHGHTKGQIIPYIIYNQKTIVFMADLIPTAAHIPVSWVCGYDTEPLVSLKEKESFLKNAVDKNYYLFFQHDLYTECCTVQKPEKGYRIKEKYFLQDIL